MNLGILEDHLLRALRVRLGEGVQWHAGPAYSGPATGVRTQVFVHAAFDDGAGFAADAAKVARARQPVVLDGWRQRLRRTADSAAIDIDIVGVCAQHAAAQALAGLAAPLALGGPGEAAPPLLTDPTDATRRLRFGDHRAHVLSLRSQRLAHEGVPAAQVVLGLRLQGVLHVSLARSGGLVPLSTSAAPLRLEIQARPRGHRCAA